MSISLLSSLALALPLPLSLISRSSIFISKQPAVPLSPTDQLTNSTGPASTTLSDTSKDLTTLMKRGVQMDLCDMLPLMCPKATPEAGAADEERGDREANVVVPI